MAIELSFLRDTFCDVMFLAGRIKEPGQVFDWRNAD